MDSRELERLNKRYLLPRLPGYAAKGKLILATPVGELLRGVDFEPSGFVADSRRVRYFVLPLYTPQSGDLPYIFARVLGGANQGQGDWWFDFPPERDPVMASIADLVEREALPWLERIRTPADLVEQVHRIRNDVTDPYVRQAVGFSQILTGDYRGARAELERLRVEVERGSDDRDWVLALGDLARTVVAELDSHPEAAIDRLRHWRDEAVRALGLAKFADPPPA